MVSDAEIRDRVEQFLDEFADLADDVAAFRGRQFDAGLAFVHFPIGHGGLNGTRGQQAIVDSALRGRKISTRKGLNPIGIGMGAPTVLAYGSEELKHKHLRRIFTGEDVWCQLFSEPGNGSDVAGIASRAVLDGSDWVVNGQKVWTSYAHVASYGMMLARTDPTKPKHKGLSYFVLDMAATGVDVRPLYQITGEAEFSEVFLTDVRITDANRLGPEGDGWQVATTTLMNERVSIGGSVGARGSGPIAELITTWKARRDRLDPIQRAVHRDDVVQLWLMAEVSRMTNMRAASRAQAGSAGPEGSIGKLTMAELGQRICEKTVDLLGADGMVHPTGYPMQRQASWSSSSTGRFLRSRANSIEGGTSEIMRNILGERVLGLPTEARVDRDVPWSQIPR
jgi:alkylation response protein AidB-like acyl-CoA dehydrogenase